MTYRPIKTLQPKGLGSSSFGVSHGHVTAASTRVVRRRECGERSLIAHSHELVHRLAALQPGLFRAFWCSPRRAQINACKGQKWDGACNLPAVAALVAQEQPSQRAFEQPEREVRSGIGVQEERVVG